MTYTFHLVEDAVMRRIPRTKKISVTAQSSQEASQKVKDQYPRWQVSMFWADWTPATKRESSQDQFTRCFGGRISA